jgi:hypothetical protein
LLGRNDKTGAHRIQFDVAENGPDSVAGQRARVESRLPEVTAAGTHATIEALRIVGLGASHGSRQRIMLPGNGEHVYVIRHETPTEDLQSFECGVMVEELQVLSPVFVREENRLAIVPACGDVKCGVRLDEASFACHTALVPDWTEDSRIKRPSVPISSSRIKKDDE